MATPASQTEVQEQLAPTQVLQRGIWTPGISPPQGVDHSASSQLEAAASSEPASPAFMPIRAVIWHPDGTIAFGLDPTRLDELVAAAAASRGYESSSDEVARAGQERPSVLEDDPTLDLPGWQRVHQRHKITFLIMMGVDMAYLIVLLAFRLSWGTDKSGPDSAALQFFIGQPSNLELPFLGVSLATDALAGLAGARDYSPLLSLFVLWSIILTAFAVMSMPLLFLFLRVGLVVAAFQLRWSLARMRNLLPPNSVSEWFFSSGQAIAQGMQGVGRGIAAPFLWAVHRRQAPADVELAARAPWHEGEAQRLEQRRSRSGSRHGMSSARESGGGPTGAAEAALASPRRLSSPSSSSGRSRPGSGEAQGQVGSGRAGSSSTSGVQVGVAGGGRGQLRPGLESAGRSSRSHEGMGLPSGRSQLEPITLGELYLSLMRDLQGVQPRISSRSIAGAAGSSSAGAGTSGAGAGVSQRPGLGERSRVGQHAEQGQEQGSGVAGPGQGEQGAAEQLRRQQQRDAVELWISRQLQQGARRHRNRRRTRVPLLTVEPPG